jgi:hypothetical protein
VGFFDDVDFRIIAIVFFALLMIVGELAYQVGRRSKTPADDVARSETGTIQAAVLGLLGLLLAFTFGMAGQRYDLRRTIQVDESNAIGTTYLRTEVLPDATAREVRRRLRDYVDARIDLHHASDEHRIREVRQMTEQIQKEVWAYAMQAARDDPRSIQVGLFVQSLNQMIDLYSSVTIAQARVPTRILVLLMVVAAFGIATVGHAFGLDRRRRVLGTVMLALLVSAIVLVTLDLDRPQSGRIRVNLETLLDLKKSMDQGSR